MNDANIEKALVTGDLSKLTEGERLSFYKKVCESLKLNPLTKPFDYIQLNGKLTLYCTKSATEQLRSIHKVSLNITSKEKFDDIYVVTARAKTPEREDEATGAVNIAGLKGDALANAFMKAETKAKRRVTLSICGLGMLDESEIETIPGAVVGQTLLPPAEKKSQIMNEKLIQDTETEKTTFDIHPEDVLCTWGKKHIGKTVGTILANDGLEALRKYVNWMQGEINKSAKPASEEWANFMEAADVVMEEYSMKQAAPKEDLGDKLNRLKNTFPGVPGPKMPTAYKDDESPWPDENEIPF